MMEPMLLEDYKYGEMPQSITNMLDFFRRNKISPDKNDIVVGFLYILMLEGGFIHKDCTDIIEDSDFNNQRLLRYSKTLPDSWKRHSSYQLDFILKSAPHILCTVVCVTISDDLLINCTVTDVGRFSLLIDPLTYFTSSKIQLGTFSFQNLHHLARNFKNAIAVPAKLGIVGITGGVCACLQFLPHEILVRIMSYLKIPDVLNLAQTCRVVCHSAQDSPLWVKLLDCDFRRKNILKTSEELKFLYEIKYARELCKILLKGPDH